MTRFMIALAGLSLAAGCYPYSSRHAQDAPPAAVVYSASDGNAGAYRSTSYRGGHYGGRRYGHGFHRYGGYGGGYGYGGYRNGGHGYGH